MHLRTLAPALVGAVLAGCSFDASIPKGAVLRCAQDAECPAGYACIAERCRRPDTRDDLDPPTFTGTFTPGFARAGITVVGHLAVSEPLSGLPVVSLVGPGPLKSAEVKAVDGDPLRFDFASTITSADAEGIWAVVIDAEDVSVNRTTGFQLAARLTVDLTPPRLLTEGTRVSPESARAGEELLVQLNFSEPIVAAPAVTLMAPNGTRLGDAALVSEAGQSLTFALRLPQMLADGTYGFEATTVTDRAGNVSAALTLPTVRVDGTPPVIEPLMLSGRRFSAQPGFDSIRVPVRLSDSTAVADVCFGSRACVTAVNGDDVLVKVDPTRDAEGPAFVLVRAIDLAGNRATDRNEAVMLDFTPPRILGTAVLELVPPAGCPLPRVTALGPGSSARVFFNTDETPATQPTVSVGGVAMTRDQASGVAFLFRLDFTAGLPLQAGTPDIVASVADDVGNTAQRVLVPLPIATTAPAPLSTNQLAQLRYERVPFGAERTQFQARYSLAVSPGAAAVGDTLVAWSQSDTRLASQLGTFTMGATPGTLVLPQEDRPLLFVQRFDAACLTANATASPVPEVDYIATLNGRSTQFNPHRVDQREGTPEKISAIAREADPTGVVRADGLFLTTQSNPAWTRLNDPAPPAPTASVQAVAFDDARQRTVALISAPAGTQTWEYDGQTWARLFTANAPPPREETAMVYDAARQRMVLFGGSAANGLLRDTWEFDGQRWTLFAGATPLGRRSHALGWDARRNRVVLFGGRGVSQGSRLTDTWEFDGDSWREIAVTGPTNPRAELHMAWNPVTQKLVIVGAGTTAALVRDVWSFDGTTWTSTATAEDTCQSPVLWHAGWQRLVRYCGTTNSDLLALESTGWVTRPFATGPGPRATPAMVWDPVRSRLVLFGTPFPQRAQADTWEHDGTTWIQRSAPSLPPSLYSGSTAYDSTRGVLVYFGGQSFTGVSTNDTWEYDGVTWTRREPLLRPLPTEGAMAYDTTRRRTVLLSSGATDRYEWDGTNWTFFPFGGIPNAFLSGFALAYDDFRNRLIVFGGRDLIAGLSNQTWEFNGTTWTERLPNTRPAARERHAIAYNSSSRRLVMFGGLTAGNTYLNDTWEWTGNDWNLRTSTTSPQARAGHALAWDAQRQRVVLAGGQAMVGDALSPMLETWLFDGTNWVVGPDRPSFCTGTRMTWVAATRRVVASTCAGVTSQTWEWDGTAWTLAVGTQPAPMPQPSMAWDAARRRLVLIRPVGSTFDTWEYTGGAWAHVTPIAPLPLKTQSALVYDASRSRVLAIGQNSGASLETWEFSGTTWTLVTSSGPSARTGHAVTWDATSSRVVLFGGVTATIQPLSDTWEFRGGVWTQLSGTAPPARALAGLAPLAGTARVVLFGGRDANFRPLGDTWVLGASGWSAGPAAGPQARSDPALVWDSTLQRAVLFAGRGDLSPLNDVWAFDGTRWEELRTAMPPLPREGVAAAADDSRRSLFFFGGVAAGEALSDLWEFALPTATGPAHHIVLSCGPLRLPASVAPNEVQATFTSGGVGASGTGVLLQAWSGDTISVASMGSGSPAAPTAVSATITDPTVLSHLCDGSTMRFQVTSPGGSLFTTTAGQSTLVTRAAIATDAIEVRVHYRVP